MSDLSLAVDHHTPEQVERARAVVVCAKYARDEAELQTFVQMLDLVDQ